MQGLIDYLMGIWSAFWPGLKLILVFALDGAKWLIGKVFFVIFDGILTVISSIFTVIDFSSFLSSYAMSWAGVPEQMIWFVNAVGIPTGITMLAAAIGLRMALNLIPSWATRL